MTATAITDHFRSVDSAPVGYSVNRSASATNGFLLMFTALSVITLCAMMFLIYTGYVTDRRDLLFLTQHQGQVAVPTRVFIILFFLTYAWYAYANGWRRLSIAASLVGKFVVVCTLVDVFTWLTGITGLLDITPFGQQVGSALLALCIFPHTIMRQARLPDPVVGPRDPRTPVGPYLRFFIPLALALVLAVVAEQALLGVVLDLRRWALLGGVGPGVFLTQQIFAIITATIGWIVIWRSRRATFAPRLAVLVPAHNEAHGIAQTIRSVDSAAASYDGHVHLYVVDNNSSDTTYEAAEHALAQCERITGVVLECRQPGKAIALNYGLSHIAEDFVCRIDADTIIGPGCLDISMRHFANDRVGSVGGMPLPTEERTLIDKVRLVEVLLRHGFFQISQVGYRGVLGVPGMFAIYRRAVLLQVGGIVQGMNGEDTDICLRMDAAGYHTLAEPKAIYYSETPASYAHLREQRTRWFRSIYHITAHNRGAVFDRRSITGTVVLPFMLANAARRGMLASILIFALFVDFVFRAAFGGLRWEPVLASVLGMPMIMAIAVCLLWRRPDALLYLPAYLCFRVLRSYFTLSAALSLVYPPLDPVAGIQRRLPRLGLSRTPLPEGISP
ncbi:glycosyltransferase [Mycolicibacterium sp. 050232]|uniref:glycosyltransferase n=1 Tax=Mycolicibacterium sp. 050232 TaxID=3113982 RepID=UPI002E28D31F|nr:glycosyltransferase [Mycolicibacterium sp. 050232]MED5811061.1 glycosyltransferase [Mycolicibacterium sp. 050232]